MEVQRGYYAACRNKAPCHLSIHIEIIEHDVFANSNASNKHMLVLLKTVLDVQLTRVKADFTMLRIG